MMKKFGTTAQRLARNPLGIIALFIVLVYGMAALVLGISGSNLQPNDRHLLVWFLVLFPVVVLFVFTWLVTKHHTKLYAPEDYKDEASFFRTLTPPERQARLKQEVAQAEAEPRAAPSSEDREPTRRSPQVDHRMADLLALDQVEADLGTRIQRDVGFSYGGVMMSFDGLAEVGPREVWAIEVKLVRDVQLARRGIREMCDQARLLSHEMHKENKVFRLVLVIVADVKDDQRGTLQQELQELEATYSDIIEIRTYEFRKLKDEAGITG